MSIRDMYNLLNKKVDGGVDGYRLLHRYEDPEQSLRNSQSSSKRRKVRELERGSYLQD